MPLFFAQQDITFFRGSARVKPIRRFPIGKGAKPVGTVSMEVSDSGPSVFEIQVVVPWKQRANNYQKLQMCYKACLQIAEDRHLKTIAIPVLPGMRGEKAYDLAVKTIRRYLYSQNSELTVYLVFPKTYARKQEIVPGVSKFLDAYYCNQEKDPREREEAKRNNTYTDVIFAGFRPHFGRSSDCALEVDIDQEQDKPARRKAKANAPKEKKEWPEVPRASARLYRKNGLTQEDVQALEDLLKDHDEGYMGMLLRRIDESGLTDAQVYHRANVSRNVFWKMRTKPGYRVSKNTVLAFAVALEFTVDETREILGKAGFSLSRGEKTDIIVEFFLKQEIYNIDVINETLYSYDLALLGNEANWC